MYSKDEFRQGVINMRNRDSKLRNEGEYWTDEERRQLAANYIGGMGITEMAILFQRSEQAICQQLAVLGLFNNPITQRKSGPREPQCLCKNCRADCSKCPLKMDCHREQEVTEC